jgi:sugar/nucleoside kinase (ribokinase family)
VNLTISLVKIFEMKNILGIGNALVDVMTLIDNDQILKKFALPKGSMTLVDSEKSLAVRNDTSKFRNSFASGGSAANTIHGLAMLGAETGFIGAVGNDDTGDIFENDMRKAGVNTMLLRRDTPTGTAVALISKDSERTFATHLGAAVELTSADLKPEYFKPFQILYMEGYLIIDKLLVEKACQLAKGNNLKIALDLASYNVVNANLNDFRNIITRYVDILFANEEEARAYTGAEPHEALNILAEKTEIAVIKTGKEGSLIKRGEEVVRIGILPVTCMDTTGAGDLYASGFLYGYANSLPLEKCGALGTLLAGNVIRMVGARIPCKKWSSIRKRVAKIVEE